MKNSDPVIGKFMSEYHEQRGFLPVLDWHALFAHDAKNARVEKLKKTMRKIQCEVALNHRKLVYHIAHEPDNEEWEIEVAMDSSHGLRPAKADKPALKYKSHHKPEGWTEAFATLTVTPSSEAAKPSTVWVEYFSRDTAVKSLLVDEHSPESTTARVTLCFALAMSLYLIYEVALSKGLEDPIGHAFNSVVELQAAGGEEKLKSYYGHKFGLLEGNYPTHRRGLVSNAIDLCKQIWKARRPGDPAHVCELS